MEDRSNKADRKSGGNLKAFGVVLTVVGVIYLLVAFNMEASVRVPFDYSYGRVTAGGEVANLELMDRRRNHLMVAALITLVGLLMAIFGKGETALPNQTSRPVKFDGEHDLESDRYRLWLAKQYNVERNEVFQKYVVQDQTFETLDDALAHAHDRNLADYETAQERAELDMKQQADNRMAAGLVLLVVAIAIVTFFVTAG